MFHSRSRVSSFKLAGMGAIAAGALAAAPAALAATSGALRRCRPLRPPPRARRSRLVSARPTLKPGSKLNISGLAYARAGLNLTIASEAIMSSRTVNGFPAVTAPALAEGIYQTTVRVPPAT